MKKRPREEVLEGWRRLSRSIQEYKIRKGQKPLTAEQLEEAAQAMTDLTMESLQNESETLRT